jgi:hypothetical protein
MYKVVPLFVSLLVGAYASNCLAANPNPKPNCPAGQIAVLNGSNWQCQVPKVKSNDNKATDKNAPKTTVTSVQDPKTAAGAPAPTTYGPVITIKPKGVQEEKDCPKETASHKVSTTPTKPLISTMPQYFTNAADIVCTYF